MELLIKLGVFLILVAVGFWRGRRNEAEHWRQIAAQERDVQDVLAFATRHPPRVGQAMDPVLVTGSVVVGSDFYRLLIASFRKIVGGNYRAYESMLERARRHAMVRLKQDARWRGARMVFNVCFTTSRISDSRRGTEAAQVEVLAYGTAFVPARGSVASSRVHHRPNPRITDLDRDQFDLAKHPVSRWWVAAWFFGVFYALGELVTDRIWAHGWRYAQGAPWAWFVVAALILTVALARLGRRRRVPWSAIIALSVLTAPLIPFVLYFAALRVNGLTARDSQPTAYVLQSGLSLSPKTSGKPVLRFPDYADYWLTQKTGEQVDIVVVRGWLGFDQYDMNSLKSRYTAFYQRR